jgi:hypothetical protein
MQKRYYHSIKNEKDKTKNPPLRRGASENEIIRWTKDHDIFNRLEAGHP